MSERGEVTRRKRVKLRGGNVKWTQTRFHPYAEAIRQFEEQIWQFYGKSKKAEDANMFGRLKVEIHWEPRESAEAWNERQAQKEKKAR
jgi:hypothetical protein